MTSLTHYFINFADLVSSWTWSGHPVVAGWFIIIIGWYFLLRAIELGIRIYNGSLANKLWRAG